MNVRFTVFIYLSLIHRLYVYLSENHFYKCYLSGGCAGNGITDMNVRFTVFIYLSLIHRLYVYVSENHYYHIQFQLIPRLSHTVPPEVCRESMYCCCCWCVVVGVSLLVCRCWCLVVGVFLLVCGSGSSKAKYTKKKNMLIFNM